MLADENVCRSGLLEEVGGVVDLEGHLEEGTGFSGQGERLLRSVPFLCRTVFCWGAACELRVPTGHVL